jgi:CDP-diacylglycerol--serine O-phosphatidyltransferase
MLSAEQREDLREHRRRRMRRRGRRAYIRSVYFLPSLATLGNAICGFAAIYIAALEPSDTSGDTLTQWFQLHGFFASAYLIFVAMIFDALDGRLARFTRHTTDFGGQLDSLADVISFGVAPAFLALRVLKMSHPVHWPWSAPDEMLPPALSRLVWAFAAMYVSCAALRLARFNVSNEHGEQHHFSFLGLPSPGAGGALAAFVLVQQDLHLNGRHGFSDACLCVLPLLMLALGLLMVSNVRYSHLVNRYLRGRRPIGRLILVVAILLMFVVAHRYALAAVMLTYAFSGPLTQAYLRVRRKIPLGKR